MHQRRNGRSTIVPGRRMITDQMAYHEAGLDVSNLSYLAEKTYMNESSVANDTVDQEEREWKKQGLSEKEIFNILERRKLKKLRDARNRLEKEMFGAKNFQELLERPEYSEIKNTDEDLNENAQKEPIFAVPAPPKHVSEKSMMSSPAAGSKGSGKAGLSCSTPKNSQDLSMRSLKLLDISHVVNIDRLDAKNVTVHNTKIVIPISKDTEKESTVLEQSSIDLQSTFTVETHKDPNAGKEPSLQKTFIVENEEEENQAESSLERTYVVKEGWDNAQNFDSAFEKKGTVNSIICDPVCGENTIEGGEKKKKSNKIGVQKRENRNVDLTTSLISSMIEDIPSPGAHYFKTTRKKFRPDPKTQSGTNKNNRLSTESDKEKTIEMLSIAEEASMEAELTGPSSIDPISVNEFQVSPIPEEIIAATTLRTPNSNRRENLPNNGISDETMRYKRMTETTPTRFPFESEDAATTPKPNYLTPTFSSLVKNRKITIADTNELLQANRRQGYLRNTPSQNYNARTKMTVSDTPFEVNTDPIEPQNDNQVVSSGEKDETTEVVNSSLDTALNALSVRERPDQPDIEDVDSDRYCQHDNDEDGFDNIGDLDYEEKVEEIPVSPKPRSIRRRKELLSDSVATVNTPGLDRRPTTQDTTYGTFVEDTWCPDIEKPKKTAGKNSTNEGMQLKKRELIMPGDAAGGVRRSSRVRVKPVRTWLGERAVYVNSPSGGKRLTGVTDVIIKDKRLCRFRTADLKLATEREQREIAYKKEIALRKRQQLAQDHRKGRRLNESQDDIHTDDEDDV